MLTKGAAKIVMITYRYSNFQVLKHYLILFVLLIQRCCTNIIHKLLSHAENLVKKIIGSFPVIFWQEWFSPPRYFRGLYPLTLRDSLEGIVCYSHTFENNLWIKRMFTKYLKESCGLASDLHFSFKCSQENAFVSKIFPKLSGCFWLLWV